VEELAQDTRLPKSTVVGMLNTLVLAGYVRRLPKRGGYSLADRVLGLSSEDAVVVAARPLLAAFTAEHKRPVSIATLAVDAMRIRATTLQDSPFAIDRERINRRVTTARLGTRARLSRVLFRDRAGVDRRAAA